MRWLGWWMVNITVRLRTSAIWDKICMTWRAEELSRPDVGSSRNNTAGSWTKSTPMETRRLSPPDKPLTWHEPRSCNSKILDRIAPNLQLCYPATLVSTRWIQSCRSTHLQATDVNEKLLEMVKNMDKMFLAPSGLQHLCPHTQWVQASQLGLSRAPVYP